MRAQRIARVFRKNEVNINVRKKAIKILDTSLKAFRNGKNWIQESYHANGGYCSLGAVEKFGNNTNAEDIAISALILAVPGNDEKIFQYDLKNLVWYRDDAVIDFNDQKGRKFSSIKTLFNRAKNGLKLSLTSEK